MADFGGVAYRGFGQRKWVNALGNSLSENESGQWASKTQVFRLNSGCPSLWNWAESLLDEKRLEQEGFFDAMLVREKWTEHLSGERNW